MSRVWLYQLLINATPITDIFADRIFQGESMDGPPQTKPFLIYRFGNTSADNQLRTAARRQYFTLYVHDEAKPGDYTRIDSAITPLIELLEAAPPAPEYGILEASWLETSADFDDREMGTILRYVRFQLAMTTRTH
jgi:hypothetical protein